ncbi:hypothetical protein HPB47_020482 [Ixodes persulcatus]|uniref:Uncharacterized protein n=1 Tax=Ixodes persulcatus TaxID=34615 RepID=A0AC60QF73_IXOPE|nr:hypothetical protein HPB47_020482 [Ixodes persulcatus]
MRPPERKHPGVYHDNGGGAVGALPRPSDSAALVPLGGPPNPVQQYVDQRQQQVTEALVDLLAGSLLDPGLVDTREFRRLLSLLDSGYEPPSASQLVYGLLPGRRWGLQQRAMLLLETAQSVSLTQDVWLGHTSCVSVCAHFILNWRLRTVFLAGRYFVDADPSESLHQLLTEALSQYGLADKVAHAAVYGAAGVVRSFQTCLPGFSACEDGAALPGVAGALPGTEGDWRPPPLDSKGPFCLEGLGCFAEALQLCVAEGLQDDLCLEAAVNKVSGLVDLARALPQGTLDGVRQAVEYGCSTWHGQLRVVRATASASLDALQLAAPALGFVPEDVETLRELAELMEPFEEAFNLSRGEGRITASYVVPCIRGLRAHLEAARPFRLASAAGRLAAALGNRLAKFEASETFALCSMLDPRFKLRWCSEEAETRRLTALLGAKIRQAEGGGANNGAGGGEDPPREEQRKSKLFRYMSGPETSQGEGPGAAVAHPQCWEVSSYLATPCLPEGGCPLEFWRQHQGQYPKLAALAGRMLGVPATAAHVLRMCRIGGRVANPADFRLNGVTFENLMFIKCNQGLSVPTISRQSFHGPYELERKPQRSRHLPQLPSLLRRGQGRRKATARRRCDIARLRIEGPKLRTG